MQQLGKKMEGGATKVGALARRDIYREGGEKRGVAGREAVLVSSYF